MTTHHEPTPEQLDAFASHGGLGPVVMLNLNRYRERAAYPPGTPDADVSGREAYARYGAVALEHLDHVGARPLFATEAQQVVVGCDHDAYDEVIAVWYPSRTAFLEMIADPAYRAALVHRDAGLDHASLIACAPATGIGA